jgi:hypothetical protein
MTTEGAGVPRYDTSRVGRLVLGETVVKRLPGPDRAGQRVGVVVRVHLNAQANLLEIRDTLDLEGGGFGLSEAGRSRALRMPMMPMTTNSSIKVKAARPTVRRLERRRGIKDLLISYAGSRFNIVHKCQSPRPSVHPTIRPGIPRNYRMRRNFEIDHRRRPDHHPCAKPRSRQ